MSRTFDRCLIAAIVAGIVLLLALWAQPASAALIAEAPMSSGAVVLLHDEPGPCKGDALLAEFVDGSHSVPGCWVDRGGHIAVVFLDGDVGAIPKTALRPPRKA